MPTDAPNVLEKSTTIRVRYADTDQMHIVYNGRYLEYFEVGRTEMMRSIGLSYSEFERLGYLLPLVEAYCRYHAPARYDDLIVVHSALALPVKPVIRIDYRITLQGGTDVLTSGYTTHAFMLRGKSRPVRPPSAFLEAVAAAAGTAP
jgi:acyl-CoA thioester hydrolase